MRASLSSRCLSRALIAGALLLAAGCTDPRGRYDEFIGRVPDATVAPPQPDAAPLEELPDITGEFLLGISPVIAPDIPLQFIATNTLTMNGDGTGTLDMSIVCLRTNNRMPEGEPNVVTGVLVSTSGAFTADFQDVFVPGACNPLTGSDIVADVQIVGTIRSADRFCGPVMGQVRSPSNISLDGSTHSAIRIAPGTTGPSLPPPETNCPAEADLDAGLPDASPPDAAMQ